MTRTAGSLFVLLAVVALTAPCPGLDTVALLVDQDVYPFLAARLDRYETDVEAQFPVDLIICNDQPFESMTPAQVRACITDLHGTRGVDGIILAGLFPYALWKNYAPGSDDKGINSFYYEDLDGTFTDTDADGYDDHHDWGAHVGPEVWVCWMRPPADDSILALQSFLDKTHAYYTGQVVFNHRAFAAAHSHYDGNLHGGFLMVPRLEAMYGAGNVDEDGLGDDPVVASDYVNMLQSNRYEICSPMGHANPCVQAWDSGLVWGSPDVRDMTGGAVMTFVYGCYSAGFNGNANTNTTMMYYMSTANIGQAAAGTSWSYGIEGKWYIFDALKAGDYLGRAWMNMETTKNTPDHMKNRYSDSLDTNRHLWGYTLMGNPFLYARYTPPPAPMPTLTASKLDAGQQATQATTLRLTWSPAGNFDLEFDTTRAFDDPTTTDVTGLTHYDFTTAEPEGYFRLKANLTPLAPAPASPTAAPAAPPAPAAPTPAGNVGSR